MGIIPTGQPAWVRSNDHTAYGGDLNKENYAGEGAVDGQTDVDAANYCRIAADMEALARVAEFATITYTQDDTGTNDPTIDEYDGMAGTEPLAVRESDGVVLLTWDADYPDAYGVDGDIHFGHVHASPEGSSVFHPMWQLVDTDGSGKYNGVRIRCLDGSDVAVLDKTVTVTVSTSVG